jgi:hypothetical protein
MGFSEDTPMESAWRCEYSYLWRYKWD